MSGDNNDHSTTEAPRDHSPSAAAHVNTVEHSKLLPWLMLSCMFAAFAVAFSFYSLRRADDAVSSSQQAGQRAIEAVEQAKEQMKEQYETALREQKQQFEVLWDKYQVTEREARLAQDDITKHLREGKR